MKYDITPVRHGKYNAYMIRALKPIPRHDVVVGQMGGFVGNESNLSQEGDCWIAEGAVVSGQATVRDNAYVSRETVVLGQASVKGDTVVSDFSVVGGNSTVEGNAEVYLCTLSGHARVSGNAEIGGAKLYDYALVTGHSILNGANIRIDGHAQITDHAHISGNVVVSGHARVSGRARMGDAAAAAGFAHITDTAWVRGKACVLDHACVSGNAYVSGSTIVENRVILKRSVPEGRYFGDLVIDDSYHWLGKYQAGHPNPNEAQAAWVFWFQNLAREVEMCSVAYTSDHAVVSSLTESSFYAFLRKIRIPSSRVFQHSWGEHHLFVLSMADIQTSYRRRHDVGSVA